MGFSFEKQMVLLYKFFTKAFFFFSGQISPVPGYVAWQEECRVNYSLLLPPWLRALDNQYSAHSVMVAQQMGEKSFVLEA